VKKVFKKEEEEEEEEAENDDDDNSSQNKPYHCLHRLRLALPCKLLAALLSCYDHQRCVELFLVWL